MPGRTDGEEPLLQLIILAGGLGMRLRPRTCHLPKPLLPVAGRPLLWYVLQSVEGVSSEKAIVVVAHKAELVEAFFESSPVDFERIPGQTMAECFLSAAERHPASAYMGLSSDVLIPQALIKQTVGRVSEFGCRDRVILTKLDEPGHKNWEFVVESGYLRDVRKSSTRTRCERVGLVLTRATLEAVGAHLGRPVTSDSVPGELTEFQTGWTLLLKTCTVLGLPILAETVTIPVLNVNDEADLIAAEDFVRRFT